MITFASPLHATYFDFRGFCSFHHYLLRSAIKCSIFSLCSVYQGFLISSSHDRLSFICLRTKRPCYTYFTYRVLTERTISREDNVLCRTKCSPYLDISLQITMGEVTALITHLGSPHIWFH